MEETSVHICTLYTNETRDLAYSEPIGILCDTFTKSWFEIINSSSVRPSRSLKFESSTFFFALATICRKQFKSPISSALKIALLFKNFRWIFQNFFFEKLALCRSPFFVKFSLYKFWIRAHYCIVRVSYLKSKLTEKRRD